MRILITGASSGIGLFLARQHINRGDEVWAMARRPQEELWTSGEASLMPHFLTADVTSAGQCAVAAAKLSQEYPLDAIIHCAGTQGKIGPFLSLNSTDWEKTIRGNLGGTVNTLRAFHSKLSTTRAKIICLSGGGATKARTRFSAYAAAKTAIVRLVETLAEEWKEQPIYINALAPGALPTAMTQETLAAGADCAGLNEFRDAQRILDGGEEPWNKLKTMVFHLLSADSDGVSGRLISAQWDAVSKINRAALSLESPDAGFLRRIDLNGFFPASKHPEFQTKVSKDCGGRN